LSRLAQWLLPSAATVSLACLGNAVFAGSASAHVKWFCAFNVAEQPVVLEHVLNPSFEALTGLSVLGLMTGAILEQPPVGPALLRSLDLATAWLRGHIEIIARAATAFFFISIWAMGGILLTPELKTNSTLVAAIQLGIAAGMISRKTMPLSAMGIVILYGTAIWQDGVFHLADYPVFLGVAVYLALLGLQKSFFGIRPIDILRWAAGITLMWASIEKWAYPEWSYPLFVIHPDMSMGFTPEFYMRAAGAVEFALAFSLVWTPLVRRVGAIILTAMFVSAVFPFGKVDLIGHTLIVVALVAIVADDGGRPVPAMRLRYSWLIPVVYTSSLALFLAAYYFGHELLFGTTVL
jgi:hypothetical protein